MNKLPEGVGVYLIYKDGSKLRKASARFTKYEAIVNGYRLLNASKRECRIYPVSSERPSIFIEATLVLAWNEAMNLEEFKEYLND
ncbi:hypothetical protein PP422_gp067 [Enterobacter phage vB_EhoM-IME523]|uniref:Uncharacterized protein n=1 Tax=Enterobacter phage vB_EhoM-IME523 TaxID=2596709 RepID=A0A7G3KCJ7_9CAUD|nr:hypothetical protein PP422_gp067 [Enterobacter phage vB_EhoM-IME523]QEA10546.1 hypothetical protein [Enterobacter phage vB_EhoM-IME523]